MYGKILFTLSSIAYSGTYMVSARDQLAWPCTHNHGRDCRSVAQRENKKENASQKKKKKDETNEVHSP